MEGENRDYSGVTLSIYLKDIIVLVESNERIIPKYLTTRLKPFFFFLRKT